ncbi:MAG: hypothetical protein SVV03_05830 [Candidatus Nanohaloarchaea archaeon]|nr:hypothetical protein [Candidatus Nanohaloarchaea archaeon]
MGCGGNCGCGGSCGGGGNCGCANGADGDNRKVGTAGEKATEYLHVYCMTCGDKHQNREELFQHNKRDHRVPEPNHCPVCGIEVSEAAENIEHQKPEKRRVWLQNHLREQDEKHQRFLQTGPF